MELTYHGICHQNYGEIKECYNTGRISGESNIYSGIVVKNESTGTITNCYNVGDVTAIVNRQSGGIVTYNDGTISNCYNIGNIKIGGIVYNNTGTVSNSHYLENCAPKFYNSNTGTIGNECTSKTELEMKSNDFISGLNKEDEIFTYDKKAMNNGYPILKWQIFGLE